MQTQTQIKITNLQLELQEVVKQNEYLKDQMPSRKAYIEELENYLVQDSRDRRLNSEYRKVCRDYNTVSSLIRKNNIKIIKLQESIQKESLKLQREVVKFQNSYIRQQNSYIRQMRRGMF